ncbi:MAG TPA: PAS domain S-box protein, partial [Thermoanaerobaculia bacterium]|nr:PAS domain S-box protein [Thermoanaerobaculia bacterium]
MTDDKSLSESREIRDLRDALQESEERFRELVESIDHYAIFLLDAEGRISSWNVGAELVKGYTREEIIGKHFSVFYPPETAEREWPEFELSMAREKGRFADEGWRIRKDGTRFWASTVITAIHGADGAITGFLKVVRDLTERRTQETSLRDSEEHFRLLVDGVEEYAIFMLDSQGNVMSWNRGAERIKGYRAAEIVGTHFSRFYPKQSVLEGKPAWELEMATRYGSFEDEDWRIRKDGSRFWANVVITALRDKGGRLRGFAKVTRDMTERRRIEDLENADRQKDQFLALLAHELRNPIAPIRTALEILRRPNATPAETDQARDIAERQLRHMARLLDDLLDVSRIREGRIELRMETLDVAAVMRSAAEAAATLIQARNHTLTIVDPKDRLFVRADPVRLEQVLGNLLNNAAKYTDPGGQIRMTAERIAGEVLIRVRDTGIGIEPLMISRVFDLFVQAERRMEL